MANKETYYLREFKKGDYLLWSVCSQCWYTFKVEIKDDTQTYVSLNKSDTSCSLKKIGQDAATYKGGANLRVEISFPDSRVDIKESAVTGAITDKHTNTVGYSYTYCIEDDIDEDYNDAYIAIIGWRKAE